MFGLELLNGYVAENDDKTIEILTLIDSRRYDEAFRISKSYKLQIESLKDSLSDSDKKNEAYILTAFYNLLGHVPLFWSKLEKGNYYDSWWKLQDALDAIRTLKKFHESENTVIKFFEEQLLAIESLYPYTLYSSPGFIVERFECSICGNDMDGDDCLHLKGELYSGEMAIAIAKDLKDIDHFAFVTNPKNKRLAIGSDDNPQFGLFRELTEHFDKNNYSPLGFSNVKKVEFMRPDERWQKLPRNEKCYCSSGKKFKHCCINNREIRHVHVDFVGAHIFANKANKCDTLHSAVLV